MKLWQKLLTSVAALATAALVAHAQVPGVNSTLNSVFNLVYEASTSKPSYVAWQSGLVPAASATDVCVLKASTSKTMRIRRVFLGGITGTATTDPVNLIKRSSANSSGTSSTQQIIALDTTFAATTAVFTTYTANPSLGTPIGEIADPYVFWGNLTTTAPAITTLEFGARASPVYLRSGQYLAINLNGLTYSSGQMTCGFEWTEDTDM